MELTALRKGGEEFPVELTISPLKLGERYEFSAFVRDITQRNRLEETLRNMNRELELRVEERTAELARSNAALERSNLELLRFAYVASHDLQSPLRSISGFVQLLQKDYAERLDQKADHWIGRIVENTRRMQNLIQDLLAYSRVDAEAGRFEPTDFREVFDHAVAALERTLADAGAEVTCGELPTVLGERSQLVRLLQNLIDNGIKYHGERTPRVHVAAVKNGGEWVFSVQDNGIGIAPKHKERIFDIFHRLHTQQAYAGTGIGLAVCRRVVHRHGGELWVESKPGEGSVFYFTITDRTEIAT
jgi:light-regulated signal transduction histidine kinase (bacteriophytochrome)